MKSLARRSGDFLGAIGTIPRGVRLMVIHRLEREIERDIYRERAHFAFKSQKHFCCIAFCFIACAFEINFSTFMLGNRICGIARVRNNNNNFMTSFD